MLQNQSLSSFALQLSIYKIPNVLNSIGKETVRNVLIFINSISPIYMRLSCNLMSRFDNGNLSEVLIDKSQQNSKPLVIWLSKSNRRIRIMQLDKSVSL